MQNHNVEVTYERDANDRLVRAGAAWTETSPAFERNLMLVAMASGLSVVGGVFWLMAAEQISFVLTYGLVGLAGSIGLLFYMPRPTRALYFHDDGRMMTPDGIFYRPGLPNIGGHNDHIVSIEARMQRDVLPSQNWEKLFEVIMVSVSGDLIILSRNMHEATALKAAAQLTHALNNLRKDRGDYDDAWVDVA